MRYSHRARSVAVLALGLFAAGTTFGAQPKVIQLQPRGLQRGHEVDLAITGTNLEDAESLMLYDSGLEVLSFEPATDEKQVGKQITVRLKVAEDCPIGAQRLRVRTRTGESELQNLHVGALPVVDEKEANTEFAQAQPIDNNVTIEGRIDREDSDWFVVEARQGQRLTAEVFGVRLGTSSGTNYFDPHLAIFDANHKELVANDDTTLVYNDSVASLIVPRDGKYFIQLRDASYYGDSRAYYLLSIGDFPRPLVSIPAGGKPGETLTVTFLGDVLGPITREVKIPAQPPEKFFVEVQDEHGFAPSSMPFRVSPLDATQEEEPNNDFRTTNVLNVPGAAHGVIGEPGDVDDFRFTAVKDQTYDIRVIARQVRSPLDPVLVIRKSTDGDGIQSNDDDNQVDSHLRWKAPESKEYILSVYDQLKRGGEQFTYRVELQPVRPTLEAKPIEFARYIQPNIEIPRGSGSGVVIALKRQDADGPVAFHSEDLPPGVRMECPEPWRSGSQMPLVFYADEDAPLGGQYSRVMARAEDAEHPHRTVETPVIQDLLMVRGRNNNRVWEERLYRLPIVVTEKLPFRVWIEAPKVPVVRGGTMNLVVRCEKQEGWDEEIALRVLENPAGVNSAANAKIEKGKTEGTITLNADSKASPLESAVAVRCTAKVGNGNVDCCTPFVPLRVAEQYVTFEFAQGAVEQGEEVPYAVKITKRQDFDGEAEVKLLGLPANASAEPLKLTKEMTELVFTVKAAGNTPPGMSRNLFCQVLVPEAGDVITHNLGSGVLRVDAASATKPVASKDKPSKPLSRLEQLRQQQKDKDAAEKSGGGGQ